MRNTLATILLAALLGCANSLITPDEMRGGGDSDQEVLSITGNGKVTFNPNLGTWTAECTSKDCKLVWITQAQANAQRDVDLVVAAGELAIKAMKAAAPVPGI